jgi:hypothetical protein
MAEQEAGQQRPSEPLTGREVIRQIEGEPAEVTTEVVVSWLRDVLSHGPLPSTDVVNGAFGASDKQLRAAREQLGVVAYQHERKWWLRLPTEDEKAEAAKPKLAVVSNGTRSRDSDPPSRRLEWLPETPLPWLEQLRTEHRATVTAWRAASDHLHDLRAAHSAADQRRRAQLVSSNRARVSCCARSRSVDQERGHTLNGRVGARGRYLRRTTDRYYCAGRHREPTDDSIAVAA